jgi:hypothetical protein
MREKNVWLSKEEVFGADYFRFVVGADSLRVIESAELRRLVKVSAVVVMVQRNRLHDVGARAVQVSILIKAGSLRLRLKYIQIAQQRTRKSPVPSRPALREPRPPLKSYIESCVSIDQGGTYNK